MNMSDFIDKIQLTLEDLIYSQQHGYIKGITNIFVKNISFTLYILLLVI